MYPVCFHSCISFICLKSLTCSEFSQSLKVRGARQERLSQGLQSEMVGTDRQLLPVAPGKCLQEGLGPSQTKLQVCIRRSEDEENA